MLSKELSKMVNGEARRRYKDVARLLGDKGLTLSLAPRLALRRDAPYPYAFRHDTNLLAGTKGTFGRIIQKSRSEGLQEIHSSIAEQKEEHHWLFLPEASLWIDDTQAADANSAAADQYLQIFLSHIFPEVEGIHTHPDQTVRALANEGIWEYSANYLLEAARPSGGDLIRHIQMVKRCSPYAKIVDSVVSHYGVTTFSINELGKQDAAFLNGPHERHITNVSADPATTIRLALGEMATTRLLYQRREPIFDFTFEQLT